MVGVGLMWNGPVEANCGMDVCSMQAKGTEERQTFTSTVGLRTTTVQPKSAYFEAIGGLTYRPNSSLQMGLHVPLVHTQQTSDTETGLGNIVGFVESALLPESASTSLNLGFQVELPTVSQPSLGDGHILTLPTIQVGLFPKSSILMTTIGWGKVIGGGHTHGSVPNHETDNHGSDTEHSHDEPTTTSSAPKPRESIVNPHTSSELLLRLDAGQMWHHARNDIRLTVRMDGVQEIGENNESSTIINLGPTLGWTTDRVVAELYTLVPLTREKRYRTRTAIRIRVDIP